MQKIGQSTSSANAAGEFTSGSPGAGVDATQITVAWLNTIQRELAGIVTAAGASLDAAKDDQVLKALLLLSKQAAVGRLLGPPKTFFSAGPATYTPTPGMALAVVIAVSAGGAGGGTVLTASGQVAVGSGGASGSFWNGTLTAAQIGPSLALTIGSGANAVVGGSGNNGGSTSIGSLVTVPGGQGGVLGGAITSGATAVNGGGVPGAAPSTGSVNTITSSGGASGGYGLVTPSGVLSGYGAGSPATGGAGGGRAVGLGGAGVNGTSPGSAGSGACSGPSTAPQAGGNSPAGMVIIYEYGNAQ